MRAFLARAYTMLRDRTAATSIEYGFLLALIVLAIMAALVQLGTTTTGLWGNISTKVQATH